MKTQRLLLFLCVSTVLGLYAAAPPNEPAVVVLRYLAAADAFTAVQQTLGTPAAGAVTRVDEKRNTVALDPTHSHAAIVHGFLTRLDRRPPEGRGVTNTAPAADVSGIGVVFIDRRSPNEPLRVWKIIPGSPAERAGMKPDSLLISVDATNAVAMLLSQATSLVRGPVGTSVTLELADAALSHTNKFTVKRGQIVISKEEVEVIEK